MSSPEQLVRLKAQRELECLRRSMANNSFLSERERQRLYRLEMTTHFQCLDHLNKEPSNEHSQTDGAGDPGN